MRISTAVAISFSSTQETIFGEKLNKIVSSVKENERKTTIEILISEARMRVHDLAHGSLMVEKNLQPELANVVKEFNVVNKQRRYLRGVGEAEPDD
ncbi:hypothetical protein C2S52_010323 [Perilla frutescens var. hirtella]|nr:hypothetical protein C2S52_010323 [Perilla frutescens var. hirtella]